jgi:hypothetical protein
MRRRLHCMWEAVHGSAERAAASHGRPSESAATVRPTQMPERGHRRGLGFDLLLYLYRTLRHMPRDFYRLYLPIRLSPPSLFVQSAKDQSQSQPFRLVECSAMTNFTSVLSQLEQERTRLASQLEDLNRALSALNGTGNKRTGRTVSAAGRARIAAAQRARWAKVKGRKVVSISAHRRKMSAAARRRIAAAQKARWAKWRKAQKAG